MNCIVSTVPRFPVSISEFMFHRRSLYDVETSSDCA